MGAQGSGSSMGESLEVMENKAAFLELGVVGPSSCRVRGDRHWSLTPSWDDGEPCEQRAHQTCIPSPCARHWEVSSPDLSSLWIQHAYAG